MKTKNYMLAFVILMICAVPLCVYGAEPAEPNASNPKHNSQKILKNKTGDKSINKASDEHKEDSGDIPKNDTEDTPMIKAQRLQYTQLLEVHRSYFTIYLQVLAIYLAVMGACLKIVSGNIETMKNSDKKGSKTVLLTLIAFAIIASFLFGWGVLYGYTNASERSGQIANVACQLNIKPVNVDLLKKLFVMMHFGTAAIIILWLIMLVRGFMEYAKQPTLRGFMRYVGQQIRGFMGHVRQRILQSFKSCAK